MAIGRATGRTHAHRTLGSAPLAATVLSALFLVVVVGGAGYVWSTLNVVGHALENVSFSDAHRVYLVLQAVDNLNESLNAYLDEPTQNNLDAVHYDLDVTFYEVKIFNEYKAAARDVDVAVPTGDIEKLSTELARLLGTSTEPSASLQRLAPRIGDLVVTLQNAYADLTYTTMIRDENALRRFGNLSVVTRVVVLLIVVSLMFVTVILWLQRRYMALLNRTHQELEQAKSAAEDANRAKGDFLATISHEIRTPMNAITGLAYLALNYEEDPRLVDYLRKIQGSANVLLRIINEVLDFSKIDSRKLELENTPFSLDEVFESLFAVVGVRAQEKGLELLFRPERLVPGHLVGDPVRLGQVLINIGTNAVKYTDTGEILVSVHLVERNEEGVVLRFVVRDSGIGIAPDEQAKIFEAFSQGGSASTRRKGGTGLGLAISKNLVEMMGGSIDVQSVPGVGSTFSFTARFAEQPLADAAAERVPPDLHGMRALVIDDNENARSVLMEMLAKLNITATAAESGKDALELIDSCGPDHFHVVFVDSLMPRMSGVRTISEIRKIPDRAGSAKFVLVTSDARAVQAPDADMAHLNAVLMKPVTPNSLLRTIDRILGDETNSNPDVDRHASAGEVLPQVHGACVLVVEDNELNQQIAREILEHAGFRVTLAASGHDALRILQSQPFDAVLMDMYMPDLDGREATKIIRKDDRHQHLPIIAMTASATAEERRRCLQAGMDDFIAKPILPRELISKLARHVSLAESMEQLAQFVGADDVSLHPEEHVTGKLNWDDARARVGGNEVLLVKLLRNFRTSNKGVIQELKKLLRSENRDGALGKVHSIKGTAANLGANSLRDASAKLEAALSSDSPNDSLDVLLAEFENELDAVMAELDSRLPAKE